MYKIKCVFCLSFSFFLLFDATTSFGQDQIMAAVEEQVEQDLQRIDAAEEKEFIEKLGDIAIKHLTDAGISDKERRQRFKKLFKGNFDSPAIADFALGRYKRRATPEEISTFKKLFEEHVTDVYANRFKDYNNEGFKVTRTVEHNKGGQWVLSQITRDGRPPINIKWLVFKDKDGFFRIYDVVVEGVSMSVTQRSEYASIIQRNGGKVSGLNEALKNKLSSK